jgi:hypothetical protein
MQASFFGGAATTEAVGKSSGRTRGLGGPRSGGGLRSKSVSKSESGSVKGNVNMKIRKMRSDSTWTALRREQREQLDDWLFEDGLGYPEVLGRVQKEFGMTASKSALSRYYQRRREERAVEDLAGAHRTAKALNGTPVKVAALRDSSLKLIGCRLLESTMEGGKVGEIVALARVLLENDQREIQRERLELAREQFHFNAAEAALAELPHVGEMTAEDMEREKARVDGIIRRLFGKELPDDPEYQLENTGASRVIPGNPG